MRLLAATFILPAFLCGCGGTACKFKAETKPLARISTPGYIITVFHDCEEGCVVCDRIRFQVLDKKGCESFETVGSTWHTWTFGKDGRTPSRFLGYKFSHKGYEYRLVEDDCTLQVFVKGSDTPLVEEKGRYF